MLVNLQLQDEDIRCVSVAVAAYLSNILPLKTSLFACIIVIQDYRVTLIPFSQFESLSIDLFNIYLLIFLFFYFAFI